MKFNKLCFDEYDGEPERTTVTVSIDDFHMLLKRDLECDQAKALLQEAISLLRRGLLPQSDSKLFDDVDAFLRKATNE